MEGINLTRENVINVGLRPCYCVLQSKGSFYYGENK